jgi:hypothetical protein
MLTVDNKRRNEGPSGTSVKVALALKDLGELQVATLMCSLKNQSSAPKMCLQLTSEV